MNNLFTEAIQMIRKYSVTWKADLDEWVPIVLAYAAFYNNVDFLVFMRSLDPGLFTKMAMFRDPRYMSCNLFQWACARTGNTEMVEYLCSIYDPNCVHPIGRPIQLACERGDEFMVEALLNHGATVHCKQPTPEQLALGWTRTDELIHTTISNRYTHRIRIILKLLSCTRGGVIDINCRNIYGETALHVAAFAAQHDIVELLLEKSANRNARDNHGLTAWDHIVNTPTHRRIQPGPIRCTTEEYQRMVEQLRPDGYPYDVEVPHGDNTSTSSDSDTENS